MMSRCCLAWSRFALSAWVGAAVLFVVNGVSLVTFPGFESIVRDQMTLVRFPNYYVLGFVLTGSALLSLLLAAVLNRSARSSVPGGSGTRLPLLLTLVAIILMCVDYLWVYVPLATMITPPGSPRTPQFITLHKMSMYINMGHVGLTLLAAWLLCWPAKQTVAKGSGEDLSPAAP